MPTVHDVKIVAITADKTITIVARGNLTVNEKPIGTPPEVSHPPGTPTQPIVVPPGTPVQLPEAPPPKPTQLPAGSGAAPTPHKR